MSTFARRRPRPIGKTRHNPSDTPETYTAPNLNIQLLRESPEHLGNSQVLELQRTVGNSATQRLLGVGTRQPGTFIQRMPTAIAVETKLGAPKKDTKTLFGKTKLQSTKYKTVLAALRAFEGYTVTNYLAPTPSGLRDQMTTVNKLLQTIYEKMNAYQGKSGKKAVYMLGHMGEVKTFQNLAARAFLDKMDNPNSGHTFLGSSLNSFLNTALRQGGQPPMQLDSKNQVGSMGGGSKTVDQYDMGNDQLGYFSDQKNTLSNVDPGGEEWEPLRTEVRTQVEAEAVEKGWSKDEIATIVAKRMNAKMNEYYIGTSSTGLGIDAEDARMNNRDVAMSRLDQLLGTHLIARAQFAVVHMPDGSTREGSIMAGANGMSPNDYIEEGNEKGGSSKQEIVDNRVGAIGLNDPDLMRQLSRLQLIDIIASQVDRNLGNYFILRDKDNKLMGITGIDNDFAFGTGTDPNRKQQEMPGISRYVDKELAQVIIALDPSLLEAILSDLLPQREIDATIARLTQLQTALQSDLTNLLEPDEWTAHAQDILNEKKSYYYNLEWKMKDTRSVDL